MNADAEWMEIALEEARRAAEEGEVPVGAVAVLDGRLLARNHNRSLQLCDPTAHAEILVLREAALRVGNYRLNGLDLLVTLEPCPMCAGAMVWARIRRLVYGAVDEKGGAVESRLAVLQPGLLNHTVEVIRGPGEDESTRLLQSFFAKRRG